MKQKRLLCLGMAVALSCAGFPQIIAYAQEGTVEERSIGSFKEDEAAFPPNAQKAPEGLLEEAEKDIGKLIIETGEDKPEAAIPESQCRENAPEGLEYSIPYTLDGLGWQGDALAEGEQQAGMDTHTEVFSSWKEIDGYIK